MTTVHGIPVDEVHIEELEQPSADVSVDIGSTPTQPTRLRRESFSKSFVDQSTRRHSTVGFIERLKRTDGVRREVVPQSSACQHQRLHEIIKRGSEADLRHELEGLAASGADLAELCATNEPCSLLYRAVIRGDAPILAY